MIGYARVSTEDQSLDMQMHALKEFGVQENDIYTDVQSGSWSKKRSGLEQCLHALRPNDVLVVWKIDRLGRSLVELVQVVEKLRHDGIHFASITQPIDTTDAFGRMVFQFFAMLAEFERAMISERTKAGLQEVKRQGKKQIGRKPLDEKSELKIKNLLLETNLTIDQIAKKVGCKKSVIYKKFPGGRSGIRDDVLRQPDTEITPTN